MKISLDGGQTFIEAPEGVRVVYGGVMIPGEDGRGELHVNLTHEGVISDLWTTRDEPLDHNIGTRAEMLDDLVERLVGDPVADEVRERTVVISVPVSATFSREATQLALEFIRSGSSRDAFVEGIRRGLWVPNASQPVGCEDQGPNFFVEFEIGVTAQNDREAFEFAIDDLCDTSLNEGTVNALVKRGPHDEGRLVEIGRVSYQQFRQQERA